MKLVLLPPVIGHVKRGIHGPRGGSVSFVMASVPRLQ